MQVIFHHQKLEYHYVVLCAMWFSLLRLQALSALVNGIPEEPFSLERGIRQGNPTFPYIFIVLSIFADIFIS